MAYKALYRTYRPLAFNEVVGQKYIIQTLRNSIKKENPATAISVFHQHLIFWNTIGRRNPYGKNIKIYECLDVYSNMKKELILSTQSTFKKALGLFYSNDFYLSVPRKNSASTPGPV